MLYAKSEPKQSIAEHTRCLLEQLEVLRATYGERIKMDEAFWELLKISVIAHDFGKVNLLFQNKIRQILGELALPCALGAEYEIPHNYISVALLPYKQLDLSKHDWEILAQSVGYHHEREKSPVREEIVEYIRHAIQPEMVAEMFRELNWNYSFDDPDNVLLTRIEERWKFADKIKSDTPLFQRYVMMKGLLHRLDHAASAEVEVEVGADENVGSKAKQFIERKYKIRAAQQFALDHRDRCTVMVASTGIGKTEASLLWIGEDKGFITLPLRVSLNAMFERLQANDNVGIEHLGLLHSGSIDFLMEQYGELDAGVSYNLSKQLSQKLTLTTIDQILKFPFYYKGFEKELATLIYSKVVVDEIQAYNPNIAAMLIMALTKLASLGGKFLVMTATMPRLYLDELRKRMNKINLPLSYGEYANDDLLRHRVTIQDRSMLDSIEEIVVEGQQRKVLVICNTVDQAIHVYEQLRKSVEVGKMTCQIRLLHARFTKKHRRMLEQAITSFATSGWHESVEGDASPGIWVTTQVVEASVDVDFDVLYTEISPLDSLFQRMGRCYRVRSYDRMIPNIHILAKDASGIGHSSVYDKDITSLSVNLLSKHEGELLSESLKMKLVDQLYNREQLKGTAYLDAFNEAIKYFESHPLFETTQKESQQRLREILSVEIIPPKFAKEVDRLKERFVVEKDVKVKRRLRHEMEQKTISLRQKTLGSRKIAYGPFTERGLEFLHWVSHADVKYDFNEKTLEGTGLKYIKTSDTY